VVFPDLGAALSAVGALISDLTAEYGATFRARTDRFHLAAANAALGELNQRCRRFAEGPGAGAVATRIEFAAEARYPGQVWELEVPLRGARFESAADVERLAADFHDHHMDVFATADRNSPIEVVGWRARVECRLQEMATVAAAAGGEAGRRPATVRPAWFAGHAEPLETTIHSLGAISPGDELVGPAIVESPVTTIVIEPGARVTGMPGGSLVVDIGEERSRDLAVEREEVA
jgi:N-methylhydantoinase A